MLLLPLLENSYKHGTISGEDTAPIEIRLHQEENRFFFQISNPILNAKNAIDDKYSGVGLDNLKHNLELVYPNAHRLEVETKDGRFIVTLILEHELK
jgi:LytS/YehU family sensor histidine kinase